MTHSNSLMKIAHFCLINSQVIVEQTAQIHFQYILKSYDLPIDAISDCESSLLILTMKMNIWVWHTFELGISQLLHELCHCDDFPANLYVLVGGATVV